MTEKRDPVKRFRALLPWLAGVVFFLAVLTFALIGPIDRTPLHEQAFYETMMSRLDTLPSSAHKKKGKLKTAWTKVNITPGTPMPMAGYKPRPRFDLVHDSLYARMMLLENGDVSALLINVDLLLFPPLLRDRLEARLRERGLNHFLYLSATHTHNGIGGWDDSALGQFVLGDYHDAWVEKTARDIADGIAGLIPEPTSLASWTVDASEWIENRIAFDKGEKDGLLRGFLLSRDDSTRALFFTYSAHATSIRKESHELSADYPAAVIGLAEQQFDFAMYMAGMVGSHRFVWSPKQDFDFISTIAPEVYQRIRSGMSMSTRAVDSVSIRATQVPIEFGPSQMRIGKNWKVRDWVFQWLVNPLEGELSYLELGDVVLVGTPCDFSGEVYVREGLGQFAAQQGKQLIITSFNGDYNGYVTYDEHYETLTKDEVRTMNWVGPYFGQYFSEIIRKLMGE